jgi:hypothetical protein
MAGFLAWFLGLASWLGFLIGHSRAGKSVSPREMASERGSIAAPLHNRNCRPEGLKNPPPAVFFAACRLRIFNVVKNSD